MLRDCVLKFEVYFKKDQFMDSFTATRYLGKQTFSKSYADAIKVNSSSKVTTDGKLASLYSSTSSFWVRKEREVVI